MNKEDKQLLLIDLCARLPYGVFCSIGLDYPLPLQTLFIDKLDGILLDFYEDGKDYQVYLSEVKPYLRPMSSMTEEEYKQLKSISPYYGFAPYEFIGDWCPNYDMVDWLNSHHFDYRTIYDENKKKYMSMIEKGLAIKVTKENNPYKK